MEMADVDFKAEETAVNKRNVLGQHTSLRRNVAGKWAILFFQRKANMHLGYKSCAVEHDLNFIISTTK